MVSCEERDMGIWDHVLISSRWYIFTIFTDGHIILHAIDTYLSRVFLLYILFHAIRTL